MILNIGLRFGKNEFVLGVLVFVISALLFLLGSHPTFAATKTWTGSGADDNWSTDANWSPSGAPVDGDSLVFNLSSLGTNTNPVNDIVDLSIASISLTNGTEGQLFSLAFAEDTTLTGDVVNTSLTRITLNGGFILGSDVELTGGVAVDDYTGGLNQVTLGGNTLTFSDYTSGIISNGVPIAGSGTVNYSNIGALQINSVNTYSGTTNFTNVPSVTNTTSDPQSPTEMFGSSSIVVDANTSISLKFSNSETFSNEITLTFTNVEGSVFNPQLFFDSAQASAAHAITVPNITLTGAGGMSLSPSGIASVDLAGITLSGYCLYVPTIYEDQFLNAGSFCGASGIGYGAAPDSLPGVPNAGGLHKRNILPIILPLTAGAVLVALGAKRYLASRR